MIMTATSSTPLLLHLGVVTNPTLGAWRALVRQVLHEPLRSANGSIYMHFVVGRLHLCPEQTVTQLGCPHGKSSAMDCTKLKQEHSRHSDLWFLGLARECSSRKSAVAEKAFEWFREASSASVAHWIGKLDDDTLPNLWLLAHDIRQMEGMSAGGPPEGERNATHQYAYYGTMGWRVWSHRHRHACFSPTIDVRAGPNGATRFALWHAYRAIVLANGTSRSISHPRHSGRHGAGALVGAKGGHCNATSHAGPYPYADGMLNILSAALARTVFSSPIADELARGAWREGAPHPLAVHDWNHEDVGIGYLVFAVSVAYGMRTAYFALQREHERNFFAAARRLPSSMMTAPPAAEVQRHTSKPRIKPDLLCATTVTHPVKRPRTLLDVQNTFQAQETRRASLGVPYPYRFTCGNCAMRWKWDRATAPVGRVVEPGRTFLCCHKHGGSGSNASTGCRF